MNTKQQIATGFLAIVIVGSVALMPVNAEVKTTQAPSVRSTVMAAAPSNARELPQDQVRDLTYN